LSVNLITPFDLVEAFPEGHSLAFVGNAPSLAASRLGPWIDGHDVVVRFNECAMSGYEKDVGTRTDILVTNPYTEKRKRPLLDNAAAPKLVLVLNPQTRRGSKAEFEQWVGSNKVLFSYTPDIKTTARPRSDVSLTTGTYALPLLESILRPASMSVTGFTMFLPGFDNHYWSGEVPSGIAAHNPKREAEIFIDIINALRSKVTVTKDISWVSKTVGVPLRRNVRVHTLAG
jgi:hypothetical protein